MFPKKVSKAAYTSVIFFYSTSGLNGKRGLDSSIYTLEVDRGNLPAALLYSDDGETFTDGG